MLIPSIIYNVRYFNHCKYNKNKSILLYYNRNSRRQMRFKGECGIDFSDAKVTSLPHNKSLMKEFKCLRKI